MLKKFFCYSQYLLPKHWLSILIGKLANSRRVWIKNLFIDFFCRLYPINFSEAYIENPHDFVSFNDFFTRALKANARQITLDNNNILSPADGTLAQFGHIHDQQLLQAKNMYYSLETLLASKDQAALFENGHYATIYLAPHNYHRVHMPVTGTLRESIFIPGKLFSVNRMTSSLIPNLYARNERMVLLFDTEIGVVAVILVGALIVGSMQTIWMQQPIRSHQIERFTPKTPIHIQQGDEVGRFLLGSTVIVLLPPQPIQWSQEIRPDGEIWLGQFLASLDLH